MSGAPASSGARLTHGLALPLRAIRYIAIHPGLWPLAIAPVALTVAGFALGAWLGLTAASAIVTHLLGAPQGFLSQLAWHLTRVAVYVAIVLASAVAPAQVLAAPINDRLSSSVEDLELGEGLKEPGLGRFVREVALSVWNALFRLLRFGVVELLILLLALVPVVGVASPVLSFSWTARWLAEQALDQTTGRHLYRWRDTARALRVISPMGFGMGLTLAALFLVPLAGLLVMPVSTVAGTLLFCDLQRWALVPPRARPPERAW